MQTNVSVEMSTIVVVKNRCQFCYAFFKDPEKIAEHCNRCEFRFAETFEAFDGKVKFACAVCFDVFQTRAELTRHEQLHKFPGSFSCSICDESFLNDPECVQHMENDHREFKADYSDGYSASACYDCGAYFEQQSYLRLHNETNCGRHRNWNCIHCGPNLFTADAYNLHMETEHKPALELQEDVLMPTAEVTPNIILNIAANEDISKKGTDADDLCEDPLLLILKDEKFLDSDAAIEQKLTIEVMEDVSESLASETAIDKLNAPSVNSEPVDSASTDMPNLQYIPKIGIGEKYKCKYCDKQHLSKAAHDQHTLKHGPDGKLVHKCNVCYVYFASRQDRNEHATTDHRERLTCKICNVSFGSLGSVQSHMRVTHKIRECDVDKSLPEALKQFDSTAVSKSPMKRSTAPNESNNEPQCEEGRETKRVNKNKFKCQYCKSKYRTENGLRRHIEDHGPDGSLKHRCDSCTIYFKTTKERDEHSLAAHKEKIVCTSCNQTFRSQQRLQRHERNYHIGGKIKQKRKKKYSSQKYCCVKCGIAFTNRTILVNHEQSNCGREPQYECNDCRKRFSNKGSLTVHMKTHSTEKNFACNYCGKRFRYSRGLGVHIQYQHTNERPHKCDLCDKSFVDISSLKVHMTIHTGIKRYVCYGCGLRYPTNSALHKHRNARKDSCALLPIQPPLKIAESSQV